MQKQKLTKSQVKLKKLITPIVENILIEVSNKQNAFLKLDITVLGDGSVEIWSNGKTITLPTQQHVVWLKNNL